MFAIPLVRKLLYAIMFKIIGVTILYFLFFSPVDRISVDKNIILEDVFKK